MTSHEKNATPQKRRFWGGRRRTENTAPAPTPAVNRSLRGGQGNRGSIKPKKTLKTEPRKTVPKILVQVNQEKLHVSNPKNSQLWIKYFRFT